MSSGLELWALGSGLWLQFSFLTLHSPPSSRTPKKEFGGTLPEKFLAPFLVMEGADLFFWGFLLVPTGSIWDGLIHDSDEHQGQCPLRSGWEKLIAGESQR